MAEDLRELIADRLFGQIHGQGITSPLLLADAVLDALGLEQVGWFVRFPSGIEAIRLTPFTNDSDMGLQQPVYARPRPEETTDD